MVYVACDILVYFEMPLMIIRAYAWHTNGFMAFETLELAETLGLNETVIDLNEHETDRKFTSNPPMCL